ncbi:MAG TPA: thiol:disulfide interchange protein DsbA/DsbL [Steroidobacteraceae bacterium]|jgi:thiol:disulfide interchange protein DsbA|nr:thiol:disulfide interchange protein DsbA/DsbL [Steroidobacteraceae bacterium]
MARVARSFGWTLVALFAVAPLAFAASADDARWVAGTNYVVLAQPQPTAVGPGKVEVTEVFSYACPACNAFFPTMDKLRASLPSYAVLDFVPAGFIPTEDWPVFQRAYYTALQLNLVNPRTHDAMFNAVWRTGELAVVDLQTDRLKRPAPDMQDIARFYAHETHVSADKFVATAMSFAVDTRVRQANEYIQDCQVDQTPTIIVNGKYRLNPTTAGGYDQLIDLVKYLVAREKNGS